MSNFCAKCGTGLTEDAKFCTNCGNAITQIKPLAVPITETIDKKKAWGKWFLIFVPAFIVAKLAMAEYGFDAVFPVILIILITILLYQRYYNKRSWHSILWGREKK